MRSSSRRCRCAICRWSALASASNSPRSRCARIGDAALLDRRWLERRFGKAGLLLADRARGIDPAPVSDGGRGAKSISREVTFEEDVHDLDELRRTLRAHAERVGADLRRQGRRARTVTLKLRWSDFTTLTRSRTVAQPVQLTDELSGLGVALLDELLTRERMRPVRLIGLGASNLVEDAVQLGFDDAEARRAANVDRALDGIRSRYGGEAGAARPAARAQGAPRVGKAELLAGGDSVTPV